MYMTCLPRYPEYNESSGFSSDLVQHPSENMNIDNKPDSLEGGSLQRTISEHGSYEFVFLLIVITFIAMMVGAESVVDTFLFGTTLVLTIWISRISNRLLYVGWIACGFCFVLSLILGLNGLTQWTWLTRVLGAALLFSTAAAIWSRLKRYRAVSKQTVWAALCIYLLIGLFFSSLHAAVGNFTPIPFFTSYSGTSIKDYLFFSFTTMTTLGYGDLTPQGDLPRTLAVVEALIGQIYLVTIVALLIGNFSTHMKSYGN